MNTKEPLDPRLAAPFDALRSAMAGIGAPPGVQKELMAAFAKQFPQKRWYQKLSLPQWGMAGGLGSMAMAVMVFLLAARAPLPAGMADGQPLIGLDNGAAFIALDSFERIEQEANPRMVQTDVPRTALAALGVPITPENAGDSVRAEMLVSAEGEPLALRLTSHQ